MTEDAVAPLNRSSIRLVIAASSMGTVFEWYDFFIYGTLAAFVGKAFFHAGNDTLQSLLVWAGFAVGFAFRPLGAILFGFLGDRLGRKYTFLVTVTLMGIATAGVGLVPSSAAIGIAAPLLVLALRVLQGLALGGEYGGAAIYVAEHAPPHRRGFYTGFIQASVVGGFVLSLFVVLACKGLMSAAWWQATGWRVPFLVSFLLLSISLWMRLKLSESPVFREMQAQGGLAHNPFVESFRYPGNRRRLLVALFGVAAGLTVISYTAMFSTLGFLKSAARIDDTAAEVLCGIGAGCGMASFVLFGRLSDRIGRKIPIVAGYAATLLLLFPLFWMVGNVANPNLSAVVARAPVKVAGPDCDYQPFASEQVTHCGKLLSDLALMGMPYHLATADRLQLAVGTAQIPLANYPWADKAKRGKVLQSALAGFGYQLAKVRPSPAAAAEIVVLLAAIMALSGATFGPVAALLCEMFPARIRYSSMSIPYNIGTGYFGGFLPLIGGYMVAKTGNPYAGLWYTWGVVAMALLVALWGLKGGAPRDFDAIGSDRR